MEESEEPSSEDGVSIESPPHKASQAIHAIDLTRDDSPASSSVVEVEIAGETSAEKDLMNIMAGQPADIDHSAEPVSIATCAGNPPILVDSDDEDTRFSSDSDDQSDEVEYDDGASAGGDSMDEQDSENEDGGDHEMDIEEEASPEPRDFPEKELENASGLASLGLYTFLNQPIPESNVRNIIDASETILEEEDHDDESDFGLSDAGAEGIRALFDEGLVDNAGDPYFEDGINEEIGSESVIACEAPTKAPTVDEKLETPKHVTFAFLPSEQLPEMTSSYSHFNAFTRSSQTDDSPSQTIMNARQPSPSDAAMVKTAIPSTTTLNDSANPIQVHHLPSQDFQKLTAQSLGDKTGKHAFFAAREDNKAKIYGAEHENPGSSSFQTANTGSSVTLEDRRQRSIIAMEKFREKKRRMEEEAKTMLSEPAKIPVPSAAARAVDFSQLSKIEADGTILTVSAILPLATLPYLDDHTQAPKAIRTPSPEPDMTSAVTYNESKASMAFANKHSFNPSGRSGLSINDIIEDAAGDHASKILKRKADGISEAIENEIRVWATSSSALDNIEESTAISASASQDALRGEQSEAPPTPVANTPEQRPAKRLRKIVESVGYVALGGATLFGALILSAPDFL